ncbi:HupE/UreJ family protein [Cohnella silvisoli]|uniref:HupE/UreJ family protein n=1 Tax=Cohnella silvisoli TaxID=2873699 RepID=A0ABV1L478_9BACL|nr:HupE/UreJ family protein [Cohnella silvisoli]MCD9026505.1 HupE/UreJ family protein [Cohnella silvisoli]
MINTRSMILRVSFSLVVVLLLLAASLKQEAAAHAYSASYTKLDLTKSVTLMTYTLDELSAIELVGGDEDGNGMFDQGEFDAVKEQLAALLNDHLILKIGVEPKSWSQLNSFVLERRGDESKVILTVQYPPVSNMLPLSLTDTLYNDDKKTNYVDLLTIHYGQQKSTAALSAGNRTWAIALSGEEYSALSQDMSQQSLPYETEGTSKTQETQEQHSQKETTHVTSSWLSFLKLGMNHILGGYDHLLFLFSLLIARQTFKQYAAMITAFTIAHSVTLSLTVLGFINISPTIVEPLIALSICFVAADNIMRPNVSRRWMLTFFFGLIHGMGFADILKEMELPNNQLAEDLISFNIGIEIVQLVIVLALVPLLYRLHRYKFSRQVVIGGSGLALLMGAIWLIERLK